MAIPVCHLLVLGSACFNPLLYGWLNDNFRREFIKALCCACCCCTPSHSVLSVPTADARTANGARSMAISVVGSARPPKRCRRRPFQISHDIELQPCERYAEPADESPNGPEQLVSFVDKWSCHNYVGAWQSPPWARPARSFASADQALGISNDCRCHLANMIKQNTVTQFLPLINFREHFPGIGIAGFLL